MVGIGGEHAAVRPLLQEHPAPQRAELPGEHERELGRRGSGLQVGHDVTAGTAHVILQAGRRQVHEPGHGHGIAVQVVQSHEQGGRAGPVERELVGHPAQLHALGVQPLEAPATIDAEEELAVPHRRQPLVGHATHPGVHHIGRLEGHAQEVEHLGIQVEAADLAQYALLGLLAQLLQAAVLVQEPEPIRACREVPRDHLVELLGLPRRRRIAHVRGLERDEVLHQLRLLVRDGHGLAGHAHQPEGADLPLAQHVHPVGEGRDHSAQPVAVPVAEVLRREADNDMRQVVRRAAVHLVHAPRQSGMLPHGQQVLSILATSSGSLAR